MTVAEALNAVWQVGAIENHAGTLRLRFPETARSELQAAVDALRTGKAEALTLLAQVDPAELARASAVLNWTGVRIMALEGGATIGVWSGLDGPEVRAALRAFGSDGLPTRYLDGAGIPMRYKLRRADGDPVPLNVLAAMEQAAAEPWKVRDRKSNEMGWCVAGMAWAEWTAAALNRLFQEQGATGRAGRITAATIRHGEQKTRGNGQIIQIVRRDAEVA